MNIGTKSIVKKAIYVYQNIFKTTFLLLVTPAKEVNTETYKII